MFTKVRCSNHLATMTGKIMTKDTNNCLDHDHWDHYDHDHRDHFLIFFHFFLTAFFFNFEKYCHFLHILKIMDFWKPLLGNPKYLWGHVLSIFQVEKNGIIAKPKYFHGQGKVFQESRKCFYSESYLLNISFVKPMYWANFTLFEPSSPIKNAPPIWHVFGTFPYISYHVPAV